MSAERADKPQFYRRTSVVVEARRVRDDTVVHTREGPLKARAGDWVVDDIDGNPYPVADDVFRRTYEPLGDGE